MTSEMSTEVIVRTAEALHRRTGRRSRWVGRFSACGVA